MADVYVFKVRFKELRTIILRDIEITSVSSNLCEGFNPSFAAKRHKPFDWRSFGFCYKYIYIYIYTHIYILYNCIDHISLTIYNSHKVSKNGDKARKPNTL